ncbi:hypothetical protein [Niabella hirudinis]|uniref:hypothetical protein n=1 Tax=Niabella hirudinis TaxID=1285929 RepID=UPI003EBCD689
MKISIKKKLRRLRMFFYYNYARHILHQRKNPHTIPVIIINYNQLATLKSLIRFLEERHFSNIVIVDNCSSYPPLLHFYEEIKDRITIEKMPANEGHDVFFKSDDLQRRYGRGYYVLTDPDVIPNPDTPADFMKTLIRHLHNNIYAITKVGLALDIESIPDTYPLKSTVIRWEKKFWENELAADIYLAEIDTTFALYKPLYPKLGFEVNFYTGIRIAGNFTAKHLGWYIDPENITDEQLYYMQSAGKSSSWKMTKDGQLAEEQSIKNYQ